MALLVVSGLHVATRSRTTSSIATCHAADAARIRRPSSNSSQTSLQPAPKLCIIGCQRRRHALAKIAMEFRDRGRIVGGAEGETSLPVELAQDAIDRSSGMTPRSRGLPYADFERGLEAARAADAALARRDQALLGLPLTIRNPTTSQTCQRPGDTLRRRISSRRKTRCRSRASRMPARHPRQNHDAGRTRRLARAITTLRHHQQSVRSRRTPADRPADRRRHSPPLWSASRSAPISAAAAGAGVSLRRLRP